MIGTNRPFQRVDRRGADARSRRENPWMKEPLEQHGILNLRGAGVARRVGTQAVQVLSGDILERSRSGVDLAGSRRVPSGATPFAVARMDATTTRLALKAVNGRARLGMRVRPSRKPSGCVPGWVGYSERLGLTGEGQASGRSRSVP